MKIIAVVDNDYGMMFNRRRVSQDKILRQKIMKIVGSSKLFMNEYSSTQFKDCEKDKIIVDNQFMNNAECGEYCFIEDMEILLFKESIEEIILFNWNRNYPSDFKFPQEILREYIEETKLDFKGSSHERITQKVYIKEKNLNK